MKMVENKLNVWDGCLRISEEILLNGLNSDITISASHSNSPSANMCAFINIHTKDLFSQKTITLGSIPSLEKFTSCFRTVSCWMEPHIGDDISQLHVETQFLLIQLRNGMYLILMPLIDDAFRCSLSGSESGELLLVAESGDTSMLTNKLNGAYLAVGYDPYLLIEGTAKDIVEKNQKALRKDKASPDFMKYYGWCSYNAFYEKVSHEKIISVLKTFQMNQVSLGFIILDAGWQSANEKHQLTSFAANNQFPQGLDGMISQAKNEFGVKKFIAWQTYNGFWCGASPTSFENYSIEVGSDIAKKEIMTEAILHSEATAGEDFYPWHLLEHTGMAYPDLKMFYDDYHGYLKSQGVDGVKIDAMAWIECYGEGRGGRVKMMKNLLDAVDASMQKYFHGELINCSSCSNDFLYQATNYGVTRTSTDFFPDKPETHGLHIFTNANTSYWMGEFIYPDWDMFQSGHAAGDFHAAARAISGGPIYSSDELGTENYEIIKKLCLSDGTIPLCTSYGKICKDSLFVDPKKDKKAIKFFNRNQIGGVIGMFNCSYNAEVPVSVKGTVRPSDIHGIVGDAFIVYTHNEGKIYRLSRDEYLEMTFLQLQYELFTVIPLVQGFAPIGLIHKYNSGGTISDFNNRDSEVELNVKDGGSFIAYCEHQPIQVYVNGAEVNFVYEEANQTVQLTIPSQKELSLKIQFEKESL